MRVIEIGYVGFDVTGVCPVDMTIFVSSGKSLFVTESDSMEGREA